jgi:hypothetical protein
MRSWPQLYELGKGNTHLKESTRFVRCLAGGSPAVSPKLASRKLLGKFAAFMGAPAEKRILFLSRSLRRCGSWPDDKSHMCERGNRILSVEGRAPMESKPLFSCSSRRNLFIFKTAPDASFAPSNGHKE